MDDTEPKFGLAVTGVVHPDRVVRNSTARAGDALVLTKPIGTGILATAVKRGLADEAVARRLVATMRRLNKAAAEAMEETGAHACTDVTGFGLLGHLREMAAGSGLDAEIEAGAVPVLEPARELAAADVVPGGTLDNLEHVSPFVDWSPGLSRVDRLLLADAQTSGGLLIAVPPGADRGPPRRAAGARRRGEPADRALHRGGRRPDPRPRLKRTGRAASPIDRRTCLSDRVGTTHELPCSREARRRRPCSSCSVWPTDSRGVARPLGRRVRRRDALQRLAFPLGRPTS